MRLIIFATTAAVLTGCAAPVQQRPAINISVPFDSAQASRLLQDGANTIKGNAFLRQRGGGVVTCAGSQVYLVPGTDYAKQRFAALYSGDGNTGINRRRIDPIFVPDSAEYKASVKTTKCDAQGNFVFDRVADGTFYLTTVVNWQVGGVNQGGHLMHRAQVKGVETLNLVMTGD